ncbi:BadF/BadG/BcrA/BcrD ATPase family protein [Nonomuraea sp. NPDC049400]|uniref:BadF/BadG/BcrA/BcrD ATPase family protein n=1 Tax=Nonomuraea sp. NPDC049400 TaxID=3364352 RepID=UPI003789ED39
MLFLGVDAGGTNTRAAIHTASGTRAGFGTAGGGNPAAHGSPAAAAAISTALGQALRGIDPRSVVASVAGVAGADDTFSLHETWTAHGLTHAPRLVSDVDVAYAAGTPAPAGTLLLAGTGAAAARFAGRSIEAVTDGLGWLLGDLGSGFWLGRTGVAAAVRSLDTGAAPGPLVHLVADHFGVPSPSSHRPSRHLAEVIVRLAQKDRMTLASAAPLVSRAALACDPLATRIVLQAAEHLVSAAVRLHRSGPIVVAGSVLTSDGPIRSMVLARLPGEVVTARDYAGAASWLAALDHLDAAPDSHRRFTGSTS